jgi:ribose transport system substrate-binding protein
MRKSMRLVLGIATVAVMALLVASVLAGCAPKKTYIPVVSKGLQHQFWQTVKAGSEAAAKQYGVEITFEGPPSEADIQEQVKMLQNALSKKPSAIALAALDTKAVLDQLQEAVRRKIPIVGFDSGVPNAPAGSIKANASTDNYAAAGLAAEKMYAALKDKIEAATPAKPVTIVVMNQDASGESLLSRGKGFRDKMVSLISASKIGKAGIKVQGNPAYVAADSPKDGKAVILEMVVPASPRTQDATAAAKAVFAQVKQANAIGMFCSNEGTVVGVLAATNDGADLATTYKGLVVIGYDAGKAQKDAVRKGLFLGSVTQDPYQIGFKAVELAYKAFKGETVANVDTGAKFYDKSNMDQKDIAILLYD